VDGWRALLAENVAEARPIVELLRAERIAVTPKLAGDRVEGCDVQIPLHTGAIFTEIGCPNAVASPTGFEPVFQP
jgi:hypothetical protein